MFRLSPDKSHIRGQQFLWTGKGTLGTQPIYRRATDWGELMNFYFYNSKYFRGCKG